MSDPVRDEIVQLLSSVTNIGNVHHYERYSDRNEKLAKLYVKQGQLRGWFVRRVSVIENSRSTSGRVMETVRWQIKGYMALKDDDQSELVFDALLDAIRAVFRNNEDLGGTVFSTATDQQVGLAIDDTGPVLFSGVLCHSARASLVTQRYF